jgi:hypothetical protein
MSQAADFFVKYTKSRPAWTEWIAGAPRLVGQTLAGRRWALLATTTSQAAVDPPARPLAEPKGTTWPAHITGAKRTNALPRIIYWRRLTP